jgi:hypothetical protein
LAQESDEMIKNGDEKRKCRYEQVQKKTIFGSVTFKSQS